MTAFRTTKLTLASNIFITSFFVLQNIQVFLSPIIIST